LIALGVNSAVNPASAKLSIEAESANAEQLRAEMRILPGVCLAQVRENLK